MKEERNPVVEQIVRFGLPLVILVFYCTASLEFQYTPDSTFQMLQIARLQNEGGGSVLSAGGTTPSPLWMLLLALGSRFHLDLLLTAKVFSLFFSCSVILMLYLIAFELLRDRVLGFYLSLVFALQPWLLQAAPSGSALLFGLMLTLTSIFFLLRNDYVLSTVFVGLSTIVFPEAVVLMGLLIVDVILNSVERLRAKKVIFGRAVIYCSTLLPWLLYSAFNKISVTPVLISFGELPGWTAVSVAAFAALVMLMIAAIVLLIQSGESGRLVVRTQAATLLWVCVVMTLGFAGRREFFLMGIPLLAVYAFMGLRELIIARHREHLVYTVAFIFAGLLLVQNQVTSSSVGASIMHNAIEEERDLVSIAYWLKANTRAEATVMAEKPGIVGYYSDRAVSPLTMESEMRAEYIVSRVKSVDGYAVVYDPVDVGLDVSPAHHFALLKRNG